MSVVAIRGETAPGQPDAEIIAALEALLMLAKAGDLRAIAVATNTIHGIATQWVGIPARATTCWRLRPC